MHTELVLKDFFHGLALLHKTLKREPVAVLHTIPMMGCFAILSLHEQQFQVVRRSQILWHPALSYCVFPEHAVALPTLSRHECRSWCWAGGAQSAGSSIGRGSPRCL